MEIYPEIAGLKYPEKKLVNLDSYPVNLDNYPEKNLVNLDIYPVNLDSYPEKNLVNLDKYPEIAG